MRAIEIGSGEHTRRISGCIGMDSSYPAEYGEWDLAEGLPFGDNSVDMFISRYAFSRIYKDRYELRDALWQMNKALKWGGVIIIKDYPVCLYNEGCDLEDCNPSTIRDWFQDAVKRLPDLAIESFAYSLEDADYQLWIVKEPREV